ncbi:hypothetical protein PSP6_110009 [Paraburkholderia tropica]|nr:hypothetical protein PSP6_110009 [Paraburkholderia tropica]
MDFNLVSLRDYDKYANRLIIVECANDPGKWRTRFTPGGDAPLFEHRLGASDILVGAPLQEA